MQRAFESNFLRRSDLDNSPILFTNTRTAALPKIVRNLRMKFELVRRKENQLLEPQTRCHSCPTSFWFLTDAMWRFEHYYKVYAAGILWDVPTNKYGFHLRRENQPDSRGFIFVVPLMYLGAYRTLVNKTSSTN